MLSVFTMKLHTSRDYLEVSKRLLFYPGSWSVEVVGFMWYVFSQAFSGSLQQRIST